MLDDLQIDLQPGEVLGIVGHSGCGKSSLALAILGLLNLKGGKAQGSMRWDGRELLTLKEREWRKLRGKEIAFVPQSPMSSLNPALKLGTQLAEAWKLHLPNHLQRRPEQPIEISSQRLLLRHRLLDRLFRRRSLISKVRQRR